MEETNGEGKSGVAAVRLTLGCAPLGNLFTPVATEDAITTVRAAYERGIRSFDVAPLYGNGLAERRLGVALDGRQDVSISTKVGRRLRPGQVEPGQGGIYVDLPPLRSELDYSFDGVLRQVEDSLQRVGRDRFDVLLLHDYTPRHDPRHDPVLFAAVMDGAYRALRRLKEEGTARAIGFGVNHVDLALKLLQAGEFDSAMLAGRYSLLDRSAEVRFLPFCLERGIRVMLAAPFASGILATGSAGRMQAHYRYDPPAPEVIAAVERIEGICRAHGVSLKAAALQFPFRHPAVSTVVVGCRSGPEIRENVDALRADIPNELWGQITDGQAT